MRARASYLQWHVADPRWQRSSIKETGELGAACGGRLRTRRAPREAGIGIVQELCESRGGRPGLSVLTSLVVSADVKQY